MTQTTARIKKQGKNFEIIVDLNKAINYKKGISSVVDFMEIDKVFSDSKKGQVASEADLQTCFSTLDVYEVAGKIAKEGEILVTQEFRDEEREKKVKQAVDFLIRNTVDSRTGLPHTAERIKNALNEANVNLKNVPMEEQLSDIISKISPLLPIKFEVKKIKVTIPAVQTGKAYGIINPYKQDENWLSNGDLEVILKIPSGLVMSFYDKLNSVTHGSALTEEIKE